MKAEERVFLDFLHGRDKNFIIPVYQRNYDWKQEQCKQLFDDLIQIKNEGYRTHFMGAIVAYQEDGYGKNLLIIDGQQRLTTLSILLLALYKVLDDSDLETDLDKDGLKDDFLINPSSKDDSKKIRLKSVKDDREAFNSIFEGERIDMSNVTINFDYFYNRILEEEISIDDFYKSIERLIIVEVMLKSGEDDPQLIFESLNSTGLDLTEADKVRNFILMKENTEKQEYLYKNYWYKIEKNTNYDVSSFLRDYLTFIEKKIPTKSKVYIVFKNYILKNTLEVEGLLKSLLKFSEYYKRIINYDDGNSKISEVLKRINKLETLVAYPFFLSLYSSLEKNIIDDNDLLYILLIVESYVFRRFICGVPTNALNKTFMLLSKEIENIDGFEDNYFEIFKYVLLNKTGSQRFPNDDEFEQYLRIKDIYNTHSRNKLHLLERLENFDNKESDIERLIDNGDLTIEHIMPQTLTSYWENELGENHKDIHEKYLHTLGNITLTGYNSKYSNKPFTDKKNMEKGFKESHLYLNGFLKDIDYWNEKNIINRFTILKEKSLNIWSYPKTSFVIKKDESRIFTLSSEDSFKGKNIVEYTFEGKDYKVKKWVDLYIGVIKELYNKDSFLMNSFIGDEYLGTKFKSSIVTLRSGEKLSNGLYLELNTNTETKLHVLIEVFKKYNIGLDDLSFYIK